MLKEALQRVARRKSAPGASGTTYAHLGLLLNLEPHLVKALAGSLNFLSAFLVEHGFEKVPANKGGEGGGDS